MAARRTKGIMAARRAKGAIGMDPARRQGVKKMDTGDGKELTDKDEKEKELKVKTIRARKTGEIHCSERGSVTSGRKKGEGTSEPEFGWTNEIDWIWTGSLGR